MIDLKSCPFCGRTAKLNVYEDRVSICCRNPDCFARMSVDADSRYCAKDEAVKRWNRRAGQG